MSLHLPRNAIVFATLLGLLGLVFSSREWLAFLRIQNPIIGTLLYYGIVYSAIFILSLTGLVLFHTEISKPKQILGTTLIVFAFFIIFSWSNPYIQYVASGNLEGASTVFTNNSEDGLVWYVWYDLLGFKDIETSRLLTYVLSPFLISLLGFTLNKRAKIK